VSKPVAWLALERTLPAAEMSSLNEIAPTDLFINASIRFTAARAIGTMPIAVARWDTRAFSVIRAG
jgi:hypothetical protein